MSSPRTKYTKPQDGEWVQPIRHGYKLGCCDCGLVHRLDFRLVKRGGRTFIQFRSFHDGHATGGKRRHKRK